MSKAAPARSETESATCAPDQDPAETLLARASARAAAAFLESIDQIGA